MTRHTEADMELTAEQRNAIRYGAEHEDKSQQQLAREFDVSQARISQVLDAPSDQRRADIRHIEGQQPPDDLDWPDEVRGQVEFEHGLDETPWFRSTWKVPREELVEIVVEVLNRIPTIVELQRGGREVWQAKEDALAEVAAQHAMHIDCVRFLMTGRHSRWERPDGRTLFVEAQQHDGLEVDAGPRHGATKMPPPEQRPGDGESVFDAFS